ncbi:hypothetical protein LG3211_4732 [Lysobacter gummosus]|nr:hypothetical protein LG3211_4732 [Lysobacter gummosus]
MGRRFHTGCGTLSKCVNGLGRRITGRVGFRCPVVALSCDLCVDSGRPPRPSPTGSRAGHRSGGWFSNQRKHRFAGMRNSACGGTAWLASWIAGGKCGYGTAHKGPLDRRGLDNGIGGTRGRPGRLVGTESRSSGPRRATAGFSGGDCRYARSGFRPGRGAVADRGLPGHPQGT